jgi:hypothetical protein
MNRPFLLALVIAHASAWGDSLDDERIPTVSRLSVTYGAAYRDSTQAGPADQDLAPGEHFAGVVPSVVHISGAYFFTRWLGVSLDLSGEWFWVTGVVDPITMATNSTIIGGFRALPDVTVRWAPQAFFSVEGHVGVGGGIWPSFYQDTPATVANAGVRYIGPFVGFTVAFEPDGPVGGQIFARGALVNPSQHLNDALGSKWGSVGGQLFFGNFELGDLRGAIVLEYELLVTYGSRADAPLYQFQQSQNRFGLGLRFRQEGPTSATGLHKPTTGTLRGHVVADGAGVNSATIEAQGKQAISDATGAFELSGLDGLVQVRVTAPGFKSAEQAVEVPHGGEATVSFTLVRPTGPGTLHGFVKSDKPEGPIEGAEVTAEGHAPVRSAADGSFTVEKVGPGPVKVAAKAKGFANGEEIVQIPPEAEASVTFTLAKQGEKAPATVRGVVRALNGKAVRAQVRITELNLNVQVKADGRFVVQVPGGKYTLVIEAPGYVTQTKPLEVADGDQAIFHCELQPVAR